MRYIIQTTLSGSTMLVLYLAVEFCLGKKVSNRTKQLMLKAAVLFYLLPLAAWNQYLVDNFTIVRKLLVKNGKVTLYSPNVMYRTSNGLVLSSGIRLQIIIAAVWGIVVLGILVFDGIRNLRWVKALYRMSEMPAAAETEIVVNNWKKKYGIKRRIKVCRNHTGDRQAFTLGLFRPVIFCFGDMNKEENETVCAHEVVHIKRWDAFWKILTECAHLVHWFNPIVWWLRKEFEFVSEEACDDVVLKGKGRREREIYASMLLEFAKVKPTRNGWSIPLSKKNNRLKERMENAMREKTGKRLGQLISLGIVVAAVMVNSLTALAYGVVPKVDVPWEEDDSSHWGEGEFVFVQDGATAQDFEKAGFDDWGMEEFEFLYDVEFVDEDGNVYSVEEQDAVVYAVCQHQYVSGTFKEHIKDANGGCTVTLYEASRCSLCGNVVIGKKIYTLHYEVCTH